MDTPTSPRPQRLPNYGVIENADGVTDIVLAAMAGAPNPRLREVMAAFVRHVKLTEDEYDLAIDFLNRIGQATNDAHNEGILFTDCRPSLPPPVFPRRASPPATYGSGR